MRYSNIGLALVICVALWAAAPAARADAQADCKQHPDRDLRIRGCSEVIGRDANAAWAFAQRARAYADKRDYDRAIADFSKLIRLKPKNARYYELRGDAFYRTRDYDRAITDYSEAIRISPSRAIAYSERGVAYARKGDRKQAIADFNEAIRLKPKLQHAYFNRGVTYLDDGRGDRGIVDLTEFIRLNSNDRRVLYIQALYWRAVANQYLGKLAQARADLVRVHKLAPDDAFTVLRLHVAEQRSNLPNRLKQLSSRLDMTEWPGPVVRHFLGELSADQLMAAAKNDAWAVCDVNFFIGQLAQLEGNRDEAARRFRLGLRDDCRPAYGWRDELRLLGLEP